MIGIIAVVLLAGGLIAGAIAYSKTQSTSAFFAYFVLGALFPLIGIIIAAASKSVPAGMVRVTCPRCNTPQNVAHDAPGMRCWRCGEVQGNPAPAEQRGA